MSKFSEFYKAVAARKVIEIEKFEKMLKFDRVSIRYVTNNLGWSKEQARLMLIEYGFKFSGQTIWKR